jgi:hypothetical protein
MLDGFGLKPGQYEEYRRVGIEPDDFLNELAYLSDVDGAVVLENLPRHAALAAELFFGERKPVPFLSEALDLFQRLKGEEDGTKQHASRRTGVGRFLEEAGDMPVDSYTRENARAFERQREGIAKAQREGKYRGRVPTAMRKRDEVLTKLAEGVPKRQIARELGISE